MVKCCVNQAGVIGIHKTEANCRQAHYLRKTPRAYYIGPYRWRP